MAKLVCRFLKLTLFIGLFAISVRYVHTYPVPMPEDQLKVLLVICDRLDVRDPDDIYIPTMLLLELLATIACYAVLMRVLSRINRRR